MVSSVKLSSISSSEELDELLDEVLDDDEVDDDVDDPEDEDPSFTSKDIFCSQKFQIQKKWPFFLCYCFYALLSSRFSAIGFTSQQSSKIGETGAELLRQTVTDYVMMMN